MRTQSSGNRTYIYRAISIYKNPHLKIYHPSSYQNKTGRKAGQKIKHCYKCFVCLPSPWLYLSDISNTPWPFILALWGMPLLSAFTNDLSDFITLHGLGRPSWWPVTKYNSRSYKTILIYSGCSRVVDMWWLLSTGLLSKLIVQNLYWPYFQSVGE